MTNNNHISANIYKLYVLCLPFGRLFDLSLGDFLNKVITQFSTWIMLLGCLVLLLKNRSLINSRNKFFLEMYTYMAISSFLMAIVLFFVLNNQYESPLSFIVGDIVLYFLVILSIFYNSYCLSHLISFPTIYKIFNWQIVILLVVGYAQLFGMLGFSAPYNALSSIFALRELSWLQDVDRGVTFFGSEPSSAAILCFIVIPYLYSSIQLENGVKKLKYIIALVLFAFLVLCSNSSQFLILFFGSAALFMWSCFRPFKKIFYYVSFAVGLFFAIAYVSAENIAIINNTDRETLEYVVLGKVVDRENGSTAMRASTVINDVKVFMNYPITGVGDGNQGYFYAANQPSWTLSSREVSEIVTTHAIPNGGGNFFPAFISAYGLIGIIALLLFIFKYRKLYKNSFLMNDKRVDTIFQIAMILFLFASWHVVGIKQSETIIFILSLPCVRLISNRVNKVTLCR